MLEFRRQLQLTVLARPRVLRPPLYLPFKQHPCRREPLPARSRDLALSQRWIRVILRDSFSSTDGATPTLVPVSSPGLPTPQSCGFRRHPNVLEARGWGRGRSRYRFKEP